MIRAGLLDIAAALGLRIDADDPHLAEVEIAGVSIDSRQLLPGNLFVAITGARVDGHDYLAAAQAAGASAALVSRPVASDLPQLQVADTAAALADIARRWRLCCPARVVGITGSCGKTTVKHLTSQILTLAGPCHTSAGNLNNEIGLPLSVCALPDSARFAVFEMGAGKPDDIAVLANIAHPDVALVNNVAAAHLERLHSLDGVASTKGALYSMLPDSGIAVINADDAYADYFAGLCGHRTIYRFALDHPADIQGQVLATSVERQRLAIRTPLGAFAVELPLPGRHNARNALAACALALAAGAELADLAAGLATASTTPGRLQTLHLANGVTLIDDSYNANPGSMQAAIDTLAQAPGQRWLVLGDMRELGADSARLHHEVGAYARSRGIEQLFAVGSESLHTCAGYGAGAEHFADQASLIARLQAALTADSTCLIKGSRGSAMDRVVRALGAIQDGGSDHVA